MKLKVGTSESWEQITIYAGARIARNKSVDQYT